MSIIDINTMFGPLPAAAADLSVTALTELMQKHNIVQACTLSTLGLLLDHQAGNAATKAACSETSSLLPVATVNPLSYFGGENPLPRLASEGYRLVRFFPDSQGWEVDIAPFVMLATRSAGEVPIMVEVRRSGTATQLMRALGSRSAPVILGGIDDTTAAEATCLMRDHPCIYVETSRLVATGLLKHIAECVGAERIVYGSSAPSRPMASALGVLRSSGLDTAQLDLVTGGNARRILGL
jgi:hypothetical protein